MSESTTARGGGRQGQGESSANRLVCAAVMLTSEGIEHACFQAAARRLNVCSSEGRERGGVEEASEAQRDSLVDTQPNKSSPYYHVSDRTYAFR